MRVFDRKNQNRAREGARARLRANIRGFPQSYV